jgi:quercetin 2,3-dioxygenase
MKLRSIEHVLPPPPPHMVGDGFRVHNFFPNTSQIGTKRMSPFFLLDYNSKVVFPPSETPRGVGVHPHRGFETVTIAYHGAVAHHDSRGNSGVIREGDIQWMTAAAGILHKEYHEKDFSRTGGPFQMVQLWVNLPAKDKMSEPKYQAIMHNSLGRSELPGKAGVVEVVAGSFEGVKGPASTFTPIDLYNVRLKGGSSVSLTFPERHNAGVLVIEGRARFSSGGVAAEDHFALFRNDGEIIQAEAEADCVLLVLSGEPIDEPIAAYGPFLMNTKQEIVEAIEDFNAGKFGVLEDS